MIYTQNLDCLLQLTLTNSYFFYFSDSWQTKIESYQDWFLKDMTRKVDESKRPEKSNAKPKQLPVFGTEGSFRKLTID